VAAVVLGAAYARFHRASTTSKEAWRSEVASGEPSTNFVLTALHEAGEIVARALGDERRRELHAVGAATTDEAVSYILANIDPKLLTGPMASIMR
jgi:hypothetical protein